MRSLRKHLPDERDKASRQVDELPDHTPPLRSTRPLLVGQIDEGKETKTDWITNLGEPHPLDIRDRLLSDST